jgi:predicted DCC family thiol-disulfide oxidoreductase YuxK
MPKPPPIQVAHPPQRPVLLFDGACAFCRKWIARLERRTGAQIECTSYQDSLDRFPEIPREACERAVQLVERDGRVYSAAEAAFHALRYAPRYGWALWMYRHLPGFSPLSEAIYRYVARNRGRYGTTCSLDDAGPPNKDKC